jgi:hypothetical protein
MWTPEQDGHEPDPELVFEITWRCERLLETARTVKHGDYGPHGVVYRRRAQIGEVFIERIGNGGMRVEFGGFSGDRAFREARNGSEGYINEALVRDTVLPILRKAMILDDIASATDSD